MFELLLILVLIAIGTEGCEFRLAHGAQVQQENDGSQEVLHFPADRFTLP